MGEDERRVGLNESTFREVNERIEELGDEFDTAETRFVCECSDPTCTERVSVPLAEYEEVRAHPDRFLVRVGHQRAHLEHVVADRGAYLVVKKLGEAGEIAEDTDPRA